MLAVGRILKAHGIRGDVKAESFMDSPDCFLPIKVFFIDGKRYEAERITVHAGFLLIKFKGVETMNDAEALRGETLQCEHVAVPEPEDGRYYIADIIGCKVSDGTVEYGKICDVLQYGSADVIVVEKAGKKSMFPWLKKLNARVNADAKIFIVDGERLAEVIVDEN